jgi:hypothetical protein
MIHDRIMLSLTATATNVVSQGPAGCSRNCHLKVKQEEMHPVYSQNLNKNWFSCLTFT